MALSDYLQTPIRSVLGDAERDSSDCHCEHAFETGTLTVDASTCEHDGALETSVPCRVAVVSELTRRDVDLVRTETDGLVRSYDGEPTALLVAAGRFVERVGVHDERLADRARSDPVAVCREAIGRAGAVSDIARSTGLAAIADDVSTTAEALTPARGPTISRWRVEPKPPTSATLRDVRKLTTGATVREYDTQTGVDRYYLQPAERNFTGESLAALAEAYERLASGSFDGTDRAPGRALRAVAADQSDELPVERLTSVLDKHARGFGLLEDLFADPGVSDVYVTAPAESNRLRVTAAGETLETNVRLTTSGIEALASRFRRESGRAFSRADPTLDATVEIASRTVRVAGVTEPPSSGTAFAFRAKDRDIWTIPALIENGTLSARGAGFLSLAVDRGSSILLAGPRGSGKTTLLAALLWELPPSVRTVVIEDTPELPVQALQEANRDVQPLLASTETNDLSPADALRTALRLGDGAIAVGEVRGREASVLYEAMRVGANSEAVLGTIHGDGGRAVLERVVEDLGVSASSFGATDLIVTGEITASGQRRVATVEEVIGGSDPGFETLFERTDSGLCSTDRIDRGNSSLVADFATPGESYADVREQLARRERLLEALATHGKTEPSAIDASHGERIR